jgi:hypothetical protein
LDNNFSISGYIVEGGQGINTAPRVVFYKVS